MQRERVGLVWDLGAGFGHVAKLGALADAFRAHGHEPVVIARNLRSFLAYWDGPRHALVAAPHNDWFVDDGPPGGHADVLWNDCGCHDPLQLEALARAWRELLSRLRIDRLVIEGSPVALLASAGTGIPRVALGNGFLAPPAATSWLAFQAGDAEVDRRLRERELRIADHVARLGVAFAGAPIRLDMALRPELTAIASYAQFDPYAPRDGKDATYFEPALGEGEPLPALMQRERFVFVYLQSADPRTPAVIDALIARGEPALVVMIGAAAATHGRVRIRGRAVDARAALAQCRAVVCHGGNLAQQAAAAGLPTLCLPLQFEQWSTGRRIEHAAAGRTLHGDGAAGADAVHAALAALLDTEDTTHAAQRLGASLRAGGALPFGKLPDRILSIRNL